MVCYNNLYIRIRFLNGEYGHIFELLDQIYSASVCFSCLLFVIWHVFSYLSTDSCAKAQHKAYHGNMIFFSFAEPSSPVFYGSMQRRNKHTLVSLLLSHIIHQMRHYMLYKGHQFWPRSQRMQLSVHCSSSLSSRIWCAAIDSRLRATDCTVEKAGKSVNYYRRTGQKKYRVNAEREGGRERYWCRWDHY